MLLEVVLLRTHAIILVFLQGRQVKKDKITHCVLLPGPEFKARRVKQGGAVVLLLATQRSRGLTRLITLLVSLFKVQFDCKRVYAILNKLSEN